MIKVFVKRASFFLDSPNVTDKLQLLLAVVVGASSDHGWSLRDIGLLWQFSQSKSKIVAIKAMI